MNLQRLDEIAKEAASLAEVWQNRANELSTSEEREIADQMARLLTRPMDKVILTKMIDQSFRSHDTGRVADQINSLLRIYGVPDFFSSVDKLLIQMFLGLGRYIPSLSVPKMIDKMRHDSSRAVIPGEKPILLEHLRKRKKQGVRMNINHLGEAVLGEGEALRRLDTYMDDLKNPEIECISIKISTIYSQIQALAFEHTLDILRSRLSKIFEVARDNFYVQQSGKTVPKSVNLDMEEYRDLDITVKLFMQTLDQDAFRNFSAGIALQAYLPDSFNIQKELTEWAKKRLEKGGSPIRIRIVKGANMEMEQIESALNNWPLVPYDNKLDVDANFKRMVTFGMTPENIEAAHLGIASHNLFELAYAYQLARHHDVVRYFSFEMLEGMADHVRRAIQETMGDMLLYAPVATRDQFINAIGYLIRRLDENTSEENFLRHSFKLKTDSEEWHFLKEQFIDSYEYMDKAGETGHRIQNRKKEMFPEQVGTLYEGEFNNEPDTDWTLTANRKWAEEIRKKWKKGTGDDPIQIPLIVGDQEIGANRQTIDLIDLSQIDERSEEKVRVAVYAVASGEDIERAMSVAKDDPDDWRRKDPEERHHILSRVAMEIRKSRGDLIGAMVANTGKIFSEADMEVSEAVDFAEYYPYATKAFAILGNVDSSGKGVGLVISPWNFPVAIPCGGIVASLAAGNTVVFKPASAAVLSGWQLCQAFWQAGVTKNVLQFLPCSGSATGSKLTNHPLVDFIILTGGTETGLSILRQRPEVLMAAETGGKNATIVTAMSDRGQAIKNVLYSAFGNCGQKCSATSLLILEKEVYEDEIFKKQLVDAAQSYSVGSAWDFQNKMGPLIKPPEGDLKRALLNLEPGESWALKPEKVHNNPYLWTPGIKWGVTSGSYTHMTEFFGPLLGVMCAEDLGHAVKLVNQTGYGLTSGLESLDGREQEYWKKRVKAGNLYINRGTTGAIVLRQPFGGMGKSALGSGIKTGGPNYVSQFMNFKDIDFPSTGSIQKAHRLLQLTQEWKRKTDWGEFNLFAEDIKKVIRATKSYLYWADREFLREKDYFHLRGQDNIFRYLPVGMVIVRIHQDDTLFEVLARIAAVVISKCKLSVSLSAGLENKVVKFLQSKHGKQFTGGAPLRYHSESDLIDILATVQRIRYAAPERVSSEVINMAAKTGFFISRIAVSMEGRLELLQYFREQSVSDNFHRHGNLGERSLI